MPDCDRCDDRGFVERHKCSPACGLIRHAADCPVTILTRCPACEQAELGDDLPSGAA